MTSSLITPSPEKIVEALKGSNALVISYHDEAKTGLRASAFVSAESLCPAVEMISEAGYSLEDLSLVDVKEGFLAVYHFYSINTPGRLVIRVLIPHDQPVLPSISHIFQGSDWHEREAYDFYGIKFEGHPNLVPLLLPDDFPGPPPLLKDDKSRAPLSAFGLIGEKTEFLDTSWEPILSPPKPVEAEQ